MYEKNVCLECGNLRFDTRERTAYAKDKPVALTRKENGILEYLLLNQGRPVSQEELIEHVWDSSVDSFSGSIRVHMSSLRKKLKAGLGYDPIVNKIGEGYKIGGGGKAWKKNITPVETDDSYDGVDYRIVWMSYNFSYIRTESIILTRFKRLLRIKVPHRRQCILIFRIMNGMILQRSLLRRFIIRNQIIEIEVF